MARAAWLIIRFQSVRRNAATIEDDSSVSGPTIIIGSDIAPRHQHHAIALPDRGGGGGGLSRGCRCSAETGSGRFPCSCDTRGPGICDLNLEVGNQYAQRR